MYCQLGWRRRKHDPNKTHKHSNTRTHNSQACGVKTRDCASALYDSPKTQDFTWPIVSRVVEPLMSEKSNMTIMCNHIYTLLVALLPSKNITFKTSLGVCVGVGVGLCYSYALMIGRVFVDPPRWWWSVLSALLDDVLEETLRGHNPSASPPPSVPVGPIYSCTEYLFEHFSRVFFCSASPAFFSVCVCFVCVCICVFCLKNTCVFLIYLCFFPRQKK